MELPYQDYQGAAERWQRHVVAMSEASLVKIYCEGEGGLEKGFFNGFLWCGSAPCVITAGGIFDVQDVKGYAAIASDGARLELTPKAHDEDVAVFECAIDKPLRTASPATVSVGQAVYTVGFRGAREPQPTFATGIVSRHNPFAVDPLISCTAGGFPGSPAYDAYGSFVGMVHGSGAAWEMQAKLVPALEVHRFLVAEGMPGLAQAQRPMPDAAAAR